MRIFRCHRVPVPSRPVLSRPVPLPRPSPARFAQPRASRFGFASSQGSELCASPVAPPLARSLRSASRFALRLRQLAGLGALCQSIAPPLARSLRSQGSELCACCHVGCFMTYATSLPALPHASACRAACCGSLAAMLVAPCAMSIAYRHTVFRGTCPVAARRLRA